MSLVTVVWSMIAAACLTLAAVHLPVWLRNRGAQTTLAFALAAISTAGIAFGELLMLKASTPHAFAVAVRWIHVPIALLMVALAGFAFHYLGAGRRWLAATAIGLRLVSLAVNFTVGENLNWLQVQALRDVSFLGDVVRVPIGVTNPWMAIGQLGVLLLMVFFADASVTAWRQGRRTAATVIGSMLTVLMLSGGGLAVFVYWAGVQVPNVLTLFCVGIVVVMGYALSIDLLRARQLVVELSEKEQEAALAAEAANLGTFTRDIQRDVIKASDEWRELFGFTPDEPLSLGALLQKIHVDDRAAFGESTARSIRDRGRRNSTPSSGCRCPTAGCAGSRRSAGSSSIRAAGRCAAAAPASTSPRASWPSRRRCACARTSPTSAGSR